MSDAARRYLAWPWKTFWTWRDDGETLAWADGRTIAFRAEIALVLERLAPGGLPPFSAVALLLAATRASWGAENEEPGAILDRVRNGKKDDAAAELLGEVLGQLDRLHYHLPAELRTSSQAKAALAELVFEGLKDRTSPQTAAEVARRLMDGLGDEILEFAGPPPRPGEAARDLLHSLRLLAAGLPRVEAETLRTRLRAGLDAPPAPAKLDLPPAERVRALLSALERDDELRGLARLVRNLMAATAMPRSVSDAEELPLGGVSDIANRGPLDRLLASELAHDDLTLAVRVAVGEALYLRREAPPRAPASRRAVLLDAGLRSWGAPRVFAAAVALALAATADRRVELVAFRAAGDQIVPIDLTTREGLLAHLEALEPDLHPGAALEAFAETLRGQGQPSEAVLVAPDDVWDDAEFQAQLTASEMPPLHIAAVNREGRFRLAERSRRGVKWLREARLDLSELTAASPSAVPLVDPEAGSDLPAIFRAEPFPLLLPHHSSHDRMMRLEGAGVLVFAKDRRLLHWAKLGRGARQLTDLLPRGAVWWRDYDPLARRARAVLGAADPRGLRLIQADLERGECRLTPLPFDRGMRQICAHGGALFAIHADRIQIADAESCETGQTLELPRNVLWRNGRFFRGHPTNQWLALAGDGLTARFEPVLGKHARRCPPLLTLFERAGHEGPIGVTARGDLYSTATGTARRVEHPFKRCKVARISFDGHRVVLQNEDAQADANQFCVVDVVTLEARLYCHSLRDHNFPHVLAEPTGDFVAQRNLRRKLAAAYVDDEGALTLVTNKQVHLAVAYSDSAGHLHLRRKARPGAVKNLSRFEMLPAPRGRSVQLRVARWPGGRVFLDGRGLLHLQSADAAIPEASLVLDESELAGWCSDGRAWGHPYYRGDAEEAPPRDVFESVIRPFVRRL